jgi:hypothetical protein
MQGFALDSGSGLYRRSEPKSKSKFVLATEAANNPKRSSLGKNSSPLVTSASVYNIRSVLSAASPVEPPRVLSARGESASGKPVEPPVPPPSATNAPSGRLGSAGKASSSRTVTVASVLSAADRRRSEDSGSAASTTSPLLFSGTSGVSPTSMSIIDKIAEEVAAETLEGIEVRRIDLRDKRSASLAEDAELDALILGDGGSTPTLAAGGVRKQVGVHCGLFVWLCVTVTGRAQFRPVEVTVDLTPPPSPLHPKRPLPK